MRLGARQQLPFGALIRITQLDAHQEAVELRFREWKGTNLMHRVLGGDHEERHRQWVRLPFGGDLSLFHRLQ